jgi:predicted RNA binding protein with dsRBD fold (UPF0201 family)
MDEVEVQIETEINPTESEDKVMTAVENVFGNIPTQIRFFQRRKILTGKTKDLKIIDNISNLLRREQIRRAAKVALRKGLEIDAINFCLNKQVAYAGHISFCNEVSESPLGPIKVKIRCNNPRRIIDMMVSKGS